jgi:hypothetical protein
MTRFVTTTWKDAEDLGGCDRVGGDEKVRMRAFQTLPTIAVVDIEPGRADLLLPSLRQRGSGAVVSTANPRMQA